MLEHEGFEVTTYRIDGEYEDARHPKEVQFTASLLEDLKRRDFTINAMAYNDKDGLVDAFDGVGDLERGVIRCVGCCCGAFFGGCTADAACSAFCGAAWVCHRGRDKRGDW